MLTRLKNLLKDTTKNASSLIKTSNHFYPDLGLNLELFQELLERCSDVKYRSFELSTEPPTLACLIYVSNMVDQSLLEEHVLESLMGSRAKTFSPGIDLLEDVEKRLLAVADTQIITGLDEGVHMILGGDALLLIDGISQTLKLGIKKLEKRTIEESATEPVIRGPRDSFVEVLRVNTTLLRRRLKTPHLKLEGMQVGALTQTDVAIAYIDGIADPEVVEEAKKRITKIDLDGVLESNYLEEFMEDSPWSPFPQINSTDRPDKVAGGLLEGQVAILVDNTPFALLLPATFPQFLHTSEDYYTRSLYATFTRLIRFVAVNIALLLPSLYISVVTFHQEMLPTTLLVSVAAGRERVPFPAFVEAFLMETTFEILREAGIRLPRPVGQAVSIVGALVIGNAAVSAGLVAPAMVIVVALTALASFIIPTTSGTFSIRLLRFPIMFLAAALGLFGVMIALMAILIHLCSLRSFGVPYLSPIAPLRLEGLKDTFVRVPWWMMVKRPRFFGAQDLDRQDRGQKPMPPKRGGGQ